MTNAKNFRVKFESNRAELCPEYKGKDSMGCLKSYLLKTSVSSLPQLIGHTALVPVAAKQDQANGQQPEIQILLMVDCLITAVEQADLSRFFLSKMKPPNAAEKNELIYILETEEPTIAVAIKKIDELVIKLLSDLEKKRGLASLQAWRTKTIKNLRARHAKNKARSWLYPRPR